MMIASFRENPGASLAAWVAALALSAAAAAHAQSGPIVIGGTHSTPAATPLTRAELRECMQRDDDIGRRTSDLQQRMQQLHAEGEALRDTSKKLDEINKRLADTSEGLIEDYNQLVLDYNLRTSALHAKRADLQRDIDQLEADRQAFNARCAQRPVFKADQEAVMRERAQAQAAASAPAH